eukprot:jgi/Tetstr1/439524/TSEL_027953.t1
MTAAGDLLRQVGGRLAAAGRRLAAAGLPGSGGAAAAASSAPLAWRAAAAPGGSAWRVVTLSPGASPAAGLFAGRGFAAAGGVAAGLARAPGSGGGSSSSGCGFRGFATRAAAEAATHRMKFPGRKHKTNTAIKRRFKFLKSTGVIKRWKQGFRHKRSSKSKEQRQRLSRPAVVFKAYAKVMKRLGALKAI